MTSTPSTLPLWSLVTTQRAATHPQTTQPPSPPPALSSGHVYKALKRINPYKTAGPDNIPQNMRQRTDWCSHLHLWPFTYNQSTVPSFFKTTTIVPLPKKGQPHCQLPSLQSSWSVLRAWFWPTFRAASQTTQTPCSLPTRPKGPPQMLSLLTSITPSLIWKTKTPISRCSLLTAVLTLPTNLPTNYLHLVCTPPSVTGF